MEHKQVQQIAKDTLEYAKQNIRSGMNLRDIRRMCEEKMLALGADSFWYWDVGAFVFAGNETALSVSGKEYTTSDRLIASNDIITIDLSPQIAKIWGDYARTIVLQDGTAAELDEIENQEWKCGLLMEDFLHNELLQFATPDTTFEALYHHMNRLIESHGFVNLDFCGNLGHSIVAEKDDRVYIEKGNQLTLGDVSFFTFEPHIAVPNSSFGYKKENIYFFENGVLQEL
ncbi:MAG: aminopeptidase P family protein [Oscillospiraceae bacterium]|nr:aminopeptidase P family protein [Oscillospiraceae bacterium]